MRMHYTVVFLLTPFLLHAAHGQTYRIALDTLTTLDDFGTHVLACTPTPAKPVKLPSTDLVGERFVKVFYSWDETNDPDIVIMVRAKPGSELLYIDKNANNDLTDDGPPVFFPLSQDTVTFDVVSPANPRQHVKLLLSRALQYCRPFQALPDSSKAKFVDKGGNLNPRFARFWSSFTPGEDFTGARGTFYFDDRVTLRRGSFVVGGKPHAIGLFDWTNNGLYNDKRDVLLIDALGNGILSYDSPKVFTHEDVFSIESLNFRIRALDPHGSWLELERTTALPTHHWADHLDSLALASANKFPLKPQIWDLIATTLDSDVVALKSFRGKYLLLNFWGEWCGPCIREIPALLLAAEKYPDSTSVQFLSFIDVHDIQKARKVIAESGMHWPQLFLDKQAREAFPVRVFPTNMLVLPNGNECIVTQTVSDAFFDKFIH